MQITVRGDYSFEINSNIFVPGRLILALLPRLDALQDSDHISIEFLQVEAFRIVLKFLNDICMYVCMNIKTLEIKIHHQRTCFLFLCFFLVCV